ncbi:hypothetical protein CY652_00235 [Burkholderia sp. WAC0059]|uniref:hypothetical protein n=1 Tax=Burkholderia sp. WAC0059 TaxID=2066022 RepID=UPI000C7F54F6|nr:hypothetical protein [Burkholderia sp. WAC0059]PLZ04154.1 hypothetical protein CY652_00235 [Burkholderia sp. WAC0059]
MTDDATDYIAPFALWLVVRRHYCRDGTLFVEPAWVGGGMHLGPAIFVSRIHAEVYATLRNEHHARGDTNNWHCTPLQAFDLREHVREMDGRLNCQMVFGFCMDVAGALIVANGAPLLRYVELPFEVANDVERAKFNFNQRVFDFMRLQWADIGAAGFESTLDCVDSMEGVALGRLVRAALADVALTHDDHGHSLVGHWAVYLPDLAQWVGSCVTAHAYSTLH